MFSLSSLFLECPFEVDLSKLFREVINQMGIWVTNRGVPFALYFQIYFRLHFTTFQSLV